jgi:hypothetical protein
MVPPRGGDLSPQLAQAERRCFAKLAGTTGLQEGRHIMRKSELDHMLELAVAKALGVKLPHMRTAARPNRKSSKTGRPMRHAA